MISCMMLAAFQGEALCFQVVCAGQTERLGSSNLPLLPSSAFYPLRELAGPGEMVGRALGAGRCGL
jgi:hypothetical protein